MEGLIFGILWYVLSLNFKNLLFRILRKKPCSCQCLLLYLGFSLSLSQFQLIFVSFVAISAVICHCFKAMSLVQGSKLRPIRSHLRLNFSYLRLEKRE